jgi:hypothetical protein
LEEERTFLAHAQTDAHDPNRKSRIPICCDAKRAADL